MAALKNSKHEAFARAVAAGASAVDAYQQAYPGAKRTSANVEGSRLLAKPSIRERVEELKGKAAEKFAMTRAKWLDSLARLAVKAELTGDIGAACRCLREIGLAMPGWYSPEKQEHDGKLEIVIRKL